MTAGSSEHEEIRSVMGKSFTQEENQLLCPGTVLGKQLQGVLIAV